MLEKNTGFHTQCELENKLASLAVLSIIWLTVRKTENTEARR